ncbi:hypothetical protein M514_10570 [Trichuris suis]|uniref:Uncharacterized protein n=1 Tax=Trichuris suis TaxID=68888 RepID=A0A085NPQ8_9BILA|nr:hypothetical protein M514_10570 [Trichuris suis]
MPTITIVYFSLLLALPSTLAEPINALRQTHRRVNNGRLDLSVSDIKYCFETEPCQFGQYKQSQNDLLVYMIIPSWCICNSHQSCLVDRWDRVRKAEIHTCQSSLE